MRPTSAPRATRCSPWPTPTSSRVHATPEQVGRFVEPMTTGRFFGTMALSEPHAGSNLADITTRAEPQPDGTYRLFGRKMWISGGDHELAENIVHLVLARTPGAPARHPRDLAVPRAQVPGRRRRHGRRAQRRHAGRDQPQDGLPRHGQHRPRLRRRRVHARRTAGRRRLPRRHREPWPAGHVHDDERGPHRASAWAPRPWATPATSSRWPTRASGCRAGRSGASPESPQVPLVEHPDVRRMLLAQKSYVEGALALILYCSRLVDDVASAGRPSRTAEAEKLLGLLIPDRQELALAVVPGRQRPGHPGARRRRLHPRPRRRAALPRQPAERDPRGHPRHPGRSTSSVARCSMDAGAGLALLVGRMQRDRRVAPPAPGRRREPVRRAAHGGRRPARRGHRCDRWARGDQQAMLADATAYLEADRPPGRRVAVAGAVAGRPTARRARSTTASAPRRRTSSAVSCRRSGRCSTCSPPGTAPRWTSTPASCDRARAGPNVGSGVPALPHA